MARRATLTHDTLVALGPEKLARLVLDEACPEILFQKDRHRSTRRGPGT